MSKQANYFRVGLFILLSTALLAGGLIAFGIGQFFQRKLYIETYVDGTVQGVEVGSAVKFRGVQVGKVTSIGFTFNEYTGVNASAATNYVVLVMEIDREIFPGMYESSFGEILSSNIKQGLRVRIEPQGITGVNYLEINYVDPAQFPELKLTWQPRNYYIPSAPGELTNLLDSVNNIMRDIENLNIKGISDGTVALLQNLDKAVAGANLEKLSSDVSRLIADLSDILQEAKIEELSSEARELVAQIAKSNAELHHVLANIEPASRIDGDDIDATLDNVRIISENLRRLSVELERDPSRLIWSRPAKPSSAMKPEKTKKPSNAR